MKLRIKLDLENWATATSKVSDNLNYILSNIDIIVSLLDNFTRIVITWNPTLQLYVFVLYNGSTVIGTYSGQDLLDAMGTNLTIDCNPSYSLLEDARLLESVYFINLSDEIRGVTNILTYNLNDEKDHINKSLNTYGYLTGNFKSPLSIKRIDIDIEEFGTEGFNYVYIPLLKRYYYVVDIQYMNNKFTRLILQEDVLMSWQALIKQQTAFVERCGTPTMYDLFIDDPEVKLNFQKEIVVSNVLLTGTALTNFYSDSGTPFLLTVVRK